MGICSVAVLMFFYCGDAVNRISICGVSVISNPSVCDVCHVFFTLRCSVKWNYLRCCSFLFGLSETLI